MADRIWLFIGKAFLWMAYRYFLGRRVACMISVGGKQVFGYYGKVVGKVWKTSVFQETVGMDLLVKPEWEPDMTVRTSIENFRYDSKTGWVFPGQPLKEKHDV